MKTLEEIIVEVKQQGSIISDEFLESINEALHEFNLNEKKDENNKKSN